MILDTSRDSGSARSSRPSVSQETTLSLAERLGEVLQRRGWILGTAESCTAGLVAGAITSVPGSSMWFERGFVTYSNAAKVSMLEVSEDTLAHLGAVSEPIALEMANGVLLISDTTDIAVSTTGIAGPDGATPGKPVGMVCFGFAMRTRDGVTSRAMTHVFPGDRAQVRDAAVDFALRGLLDVLDA